jgi:hypothetical protein
MQSPTHTHYKVTICVKVKVKSEGMCAGTHAHAHTFYRALACRMSWLRRDSVCLCVLNNFTIAAILHRQVRLVKPCHKHRLPALRIHLAKPNQGPIR